MIKNLINRLKDTSIKIESQKKLRGHNDTINICGRCAHYLTEKPGVGFCAMYPIAQRNNVAGTEAEVSFNREACVEYFTHGARHTYKDNNQ